MTLAEITRIVMEALNITSDGQVSSAVVEGQVSVLVSIPSNQTLDAEIMREHVTEGLVQEYGQETTISVQVVQTEDATADDANSESFLQSEAFVVVVAAIAGIACLIVSAGVLLLWRRRNTSSKSVISINASSPSTGTNEMEPIVEANPDAQLNDALSDDRADLDDMYDQHSSTKAAVEVDHVNTTPATSPGQV